MARAGEAGENAGGREVARLEHRREQEAESGESQWQVGQVSLARF